MKTNLKSRTVLAAVVTAASLMVATSANAALVTWGGWTNVTDNTAIQTLPGYSTYGGVNFNGSTTTINNGPGGVGGTNVVFTGIAQNASGATAGITVGSTGFAFQSTIASNSSVVSAVGAPQNWGTTLDRVIGDDNNAATIDLSGLTVGSSYYVQFFSSAPDANILNNSTITSGGVLGPAFGNHASGATRYLIGSFTANGTSQSFSVAGTEPTYSALVIGVQAAVVPEPTSVAIWSVLGLLGLGFAGIARRRKR